MTETKTIVCKFEHAKTTKGAHQYQEIEEKKNGKTTDKKIVTLYLRKTALDGDVPKEITATVEYTV